MENHMENDDATVGRILTRREALRAAARAGLGLAAIGGAHKLGYAAPGPDTQPKVHLVASPTLTEGPFFVDENLNRSDLIAGTTRHSVKNGIPLQVSFTLYKLSGATHTLLQGAHIDVWHADAIGVYSDENNPMNHEMTSHQQWLRGFQVTDGTGAATFKTIFPGWYPGRTPHIHFKIRTYSSAAKVTAEFTSQLFFKDADARRIYTVDPYTLAGQRDTTNANDNIFNERQHDGTVAGDHMILDLKKLTGSAGYSANFTVVLTEQNLHAGRGGRPGGPPRGGFGGPPPGGPPPDGGFGGPPPGDGPPPGGLY
jgi:protocatechuate 3,4-dioxygenase beta subunit